MTRVLLADDHRIIRQGLRALLETDDGFDVVAEAEDGRSAVWLAADRQPDVIVMDVAMPDLDGIAATRQIVARDSRAKVVALSALSDTVSIMRVLDAGASGYLTKNGAFDELAAAIRTVVAGMVYVSPDLKGRFPPGELDRYFARGAG
jgi:DNA-binding NarL/FixJ family response regulator